MATENLKVIGLDGILTGLFGKDEDSKNLIIDCAEVHFETHDLRNGTARYTLVSGIDFLLFLQDMRNDGHKITQEQIGFCDRGFSGGNMHDKDVFINLEV